MKRSSALLFALALGCSASGGPGSATKAVILTTFQPLYSFTSKVVQGSPALEVVNLAPRKMGPHEFNLDDPSQGERCRALVRRATALVTLRSLPVARASR